MNHPLPLPGTTRRSLAHYLKALGVFRLLSEQLSLGVTGCWSGDVFVLGNPLEREEVLSFFLRTYTPTPILAPWNGGSGFGPKDNRDALNILRDSPCPRFAPLSMAITSGTQARQLLGIGEKPTKEQKFDLLQLCRATWPDVAVLWLDAAVVLTGDEPRFPPLLGTGGNDGRLDFTNNYMQRLVELFDPETGDPRPHSRELLESSLFDEVTCALSRGSPIGQFSPGAAGGANGSSSFSADSLINPWDYVLMLEGALCFASAAVRRLGARSGPTLPSYPFTVQPTAVGYGSAGASDESKSRAEMWLPLWQAPCHYHELTSILAEGRAQLGAGPARDGLDFAQAAASLGVDRGLTGFMRVSFQERNGLAYLAIPMGDFVVGKRPGADLLAEIHRQVNQLRRAANGDHAPASVSRAVRRLTRAIFEVCNQRETSVAGAASHHPALFEVLLSLGQVEMALSRSLKWTVEQNLEPITLSPAWLRCVPLSELETRLVWSLVQARYSGIRPPQADGYPPPLEPLRLLREPLSVGKFGKLSFDADRRQDVLPSEVGFTRHLSDLFGEILLRSERQHTFTVQATSFTHPRDVAAYLSGEVDITRLEEYLDALQLVKTPPRPLDLHRVDMGPLLPSAFFCLLQAVLPLNPTVHPEVDTVAPPLYDRRPFSLAAAGHPQRSSQAAAHRLQAMDKTPAVTRVLAPRDECERVLGALLFPLSAQDRNTLTARVVRPGARNSDQDQSTSST